MSLFSPCKDSQDSLYCTTFQLFNGLHFVSLLSLAYFTIFEFCLFVCLFFLGGYPVFKSTFRGIMTF